MQVFELLWTFSNFQFCFSGCVLIFVFVLLVRTPAGILSPAVGLQICPITAGIKKYKSIIKKKWKKDDKIVLLAKTILKTIEVLIPKVLIDWYINPNLVGVGGGG